MGGKEDCVVSQAAPAQFDGVGRQRRDRAGLPVEQGGGGLGAQEAVDLLPVRIGAGEQLPRVVVDETTEDPQEGCDAANQSSPEVPAEPEHTVGVNTTLRIGGLACPARTPAQPADDQSGQGREQGDARHPQ
ncbi:hypothetical protein SDC9_187772 [bioreactor metagenome]|uniref:Uncharacterized protein n=1 Tax=bioreactor metagenome TaxID=1076179 RepID=A0A645HNT4_9ZZZZ